MSKREGQEGTSRVTLGDVKGHPLVEAYILKANDHLAAMGFTEHGKRHTSLVARIAYNVLERLGHSEEEAELAAIAGYTHDIGNVVSRANHPMAGAVIMERLLREIGMSYDDVATVIGAIGNHEEGMGVSVNKVAAAVILADKSDVHRTRVQEKEYVAFDIHDRVNYAVDRSFLDVDPDSKEITLEIDIDTDISPVMDYFEIFLSRMVMCRRAAEFLACTFHLHINGADLL